MCGAHYSSSGHMVFQHYRTRFTPPLYPTLHAQPALYLYNSWYARESSELVGGCLAVCGREAVQQCRLKEEEGREEEEREKER